MIIPSTQSKRFFPIIKKAKGKYVWDIEGNRYIDFTCSNLTVVLGHQSFNIKESPNYPGISNLEIEASTILSSFTGTNYFRYFKNGSDAVSCAIRIARNILQNKHVSIGFIGYHGSLNEYVYTFNKNGIPYHDTFQIKDTLKDCDILVFESRYAKTADKIKASIKICDCLKDGIKALFQPTWFRYKNPYDFLILGKSIANGYPISVLTGKNELMKGINDIYYSTTFGGENTGLRAMLLTISKVEKALPKFFALYEYATSKLPEWKSFDKEKVNYFLKHGYLCNGHWGIMLCHSKKDIDNLSKLYLKI
jgi:glutamate-1-semialdehyde aminotransferase